MNEHELQVHLERGLESLRREFAGKVPPHRVNEIGRERFEALSQHARINDFIPLLVFRETREELRLRESGELQRVA